MRKFVILLTASAIAACSTGPQPMARSAEAEAELQRLLAGKVAGTPMACLQSWRADQMVVIDDSTVVFKDGNTVYRNELGGECSNLSNGFYTFVTRNSGGSGLCSGEIADVVDIATGTIHGSCTIGEFVPYRAP